MGYCFRQHSQNWLAKYWTLLHVFLEYKSGDSNLPGGGSATSSFEGKEVVRC